MSDLIPGLSAITQIIIVIVAFSILIFVHELGHYLAARFTGVRVERFFIGFDIFNLAIKKEYKGTVYGIGILPLGGYCALAGQNDDPRKEIKTGAPDELQSKPLWAQALVFGGGVLMNFLFGFLVLIAAYMYGVPYIPATLGALDPNGPAAVHGFRSGDRIIRIDGNEVDSFEDAVEAIAMAGSGGEITIDFLRDSGGKAEPMTISVKGEASSMRGNLNTIRAEPAKSRIIAGIVDDPAFVEKIGGKIAPGDEILAVNGIELPKDQGHMLPEMLANQPGKTVDLTVKSAKDGQVRDVVIPLETYGSWDMGLRIGLQVVTVVPGGPAEEAGFKPGDLAVAYQRADDPQPMRFSADKSFQDVVAESALRCVDLDINRNGKTISATVKPNLTLGSPDLDTERDTLLGVIGDMEGDNGFHIESVAPDSPADGVVLPGDYLVGINGKPLPKGKSLREVVEDVSCEQIKFFVNRPGDDTAPLASVPDANLVLELSPRIMPDYHRPMIGLSWTAGPVTAVEPGSFADENLGGAARLRGKRLALLQYSPDLATTTLAFVSDNTGPDAKPEIITADTPDYIRDDPLSAGLRSQLPLSLRTAEVVTPLPFIPAVKMAAKKWVHLSLMIYEVIHKLIVRTLPLEAVGGPVQLFRIINAADERGFAYFLYVVALISVNLGVCNLLPLPVLDGGHLLWLLLEWVMGKPPPQKIKDTAQWIGLVFLLTLMVTVTFNDVFHIFKGTG